MRNRGDLRSVHGTPRHLIFSKDGPSRILEASRERTALADLLKASQNPGVPASVSGRLGT